MGNKTDAAEHLVNATEDVCGLRRQRLKHEAERGVLLCRRRLLPLFYNFTGDCCGLFRLGSINTPRTRRGGEKVK